MKKGLNNWFEIFRTGNHTDGLGKTKIWTEEDLKDIAAKTDLQEFSVPLVVGHPKCNYPAYGFVSELKVEGGTLFAKAKDVSEKFEEFVKSSAKGRSIALEGGRLKHIGFLAVENPAVRGLAEIEFAEAENLETYEFGISAWSVNYKFEQAGRIFQKLRDLLIEKYGLETADNVIAQWWIDDLKTALQDETGKALNAFAEKLTEELNLKINQNQTQSDFSEQLQAKDAENAKLLEQIAALNQQKRQDDFTAFCDELVQKGQVTPAQKELAVKCFNEASKPTSYEFSEDGKHTVIDAVKELLSALPKQIEFGEFVKKPNAAGVSEDEDMKLAEKIASAK